MSTTDTSPLVAALSKRGATRDKTETDTATPAELADRAEQLAGDLTAWVVDVRASLDDEADDDGNGDGERR